MYTVNTTETHLFVITTQACLLLMLFKSYTYLQNNTATVTVNSSEQ